MLMEGIMCANEPLDMSCSAVLSNVCRVLFLDHRRVFVSSYVTFPHHITSFCHDNSDWYHNVPIPNSLWLTKFYLYFHNVPKNRYIYAPGLPSPRWTGMSLCRIMLIICTRGSGFTRHGSKHIVLSYCRLWGLCSDAYWGLATGAATPRPAICN